MAMAHARPREMMFIFLIGIFDIAHALSSVCLPMCGGGTE
jgi:hypothetical protein